MIILGMNFFADATSISNFTSLSVDNVNNIEVKNGIYDTVYITNDTENKEIPESWTSSTQVLATFDDNNTVAGNINWFSDNTKSILLKRKEENENWLTIYQQPINSINDFNFTYDDYLCAGDRFFEYAIVPVSHDNVERAYMYAYQKDTEDYGITTKFDGISIIGANNKVFTTVLEPGDCDTTRNQKVGIMELMYGSKPKIFQNSQLNYETGTTSGFFVEFDEHCYIDLRKGYIYRKEFIDFLTDGKPKYIKSWDGRCWLVMVTGNPTDTTGDHHDIRIIEFEWCEVGDTYSEKDLYEMGFINVPSEFWSNYYP